MTVEKSFDGTTGTGVKLEAQVVVAGAASDVNGLAPVGRGIFTVASQIAQIFPGIPRIRDTTNDKIAHVAGQVTDPVGAGIDPVGSHLGWAEHAVLVAVEEAEQSEDKER